jgi:MFS family permease
MVLRPKATLTEKEVNAGLKRVIGDGLASEAMTTLTGGAFMVALALMLGASNLQIGILAALPTFTNVFQLVSIWLVRRYNNRRAISVICSLLARLPLIVIGLLPLLAPSLASVQVIIFFLFFYYMFGSIAGLSWNSWMKDLVPDNILGTYFSKRSSYMQTLNVILSLILAFLLDYIKSKYPQFELTAYATMFIAAGSIGIIGAFVLARAPEPQSYLPKENIIKLFKRPLKDGNFRRLLLFNSAWIFAVNIAVPFFTVFMMKTLGLSLTYIIAFTILGQITSILTIRMWGRFADRYSNKTIIAIGAPLYILCILGWCFVGIYTHHYNNLILLAVIHIVMGFSNAGINLSLTNIGLKLAPADNSIIYLSVKNIFVAVFSTIAPLAGGAMADFFTSRNLKIDIQYTGPKISKVIHVVSLHQWNFLFLIGALLALLALELLVSVKETGEVDKDEVRRIMRSSIRSNLKEYFLIGHLISWQEHLWTILRLKKKKTTEDNL